MTTGSRGALACPPDGARGWFLVRMITPWALLALLVVASSSAFPQDSLSIVLSDDSEHYRQVALAFHEVVTARHPQLDIQVMGKGQLKEGTIPLQQLLVTIGTDAALDARSRFPANPRLNLFITESAWRDLDRTPSPDQRQAAILVDQPLERFLHLALLLKPDAKVVATAFGEVSYRQREQFVALAQQHGLSLIDILLHDRDNPVTALTPLFSASDIFIAVPDRGLFNQSVARWALFLGYRHKVPVVGFSRAYTQAGALVSLQSDPAAVGRQGAAWLDRYLLWQNSQASTSAQPAVTSENKPSEDHDLWRAFPPQDFSVALNPFVARALDIVTGSEDWLHQQLSRRLDAEPSP